MKRILVLLAAAGFLTPISVRAQSTLALQEKCAEGAKKLYKEILWGGFNPSLL